jgi:DNA-binding LacI/PurR family transcriptional regulator
VFLDGRPRDGGYPAIVPDDRGGAVAAVGELLAAGHRRIAFVDDELSPLASELRGQGYRDALDAAGVGCDPALHATAFPSAAGGLAAAGRLLDLPAATRPTAIFCFNDRMAMGAYRAVRHRGLRIPDDVSVVGYDDQQFIAADLDPPLTTVALPHYEMGRWAVQTLLANLGAAAPVEDVVAQPCPLVRRASVAAPREVAPARADPPGDPPARRAGRQVP